MTPTSKKTLAISLAIALGVAIMPLTGYTADNKGGIYNKPSSGDYTGSLDGINVATENAKVIVDVKDVLGDVYGGYSDADVEVKNNTVIITDRTVSDRIFGGWVNVGNATDNRVTVSNANVGEVTGGFSRFGNVTGNSVTISGDDTHIISGSVMGGVSRSGDVIGNSVIISGSTFNKSVYGAYSNNTNADSGNAIGNTLIITGGTLKDSVYGGASYTDTVSGNADRNTIIITNGTFDKDVIGGDTSGSVSGNAIGNTVTINGGKFKGQVIGGTASGNAIGNTVTINGGEFKEQVIGGTASGNAISNTVTINGGEFDSGVSIYGGYEVGGIIRSTGNTLNWGHIGSVKSVAGFENYNFYIPASAKSGDTLLKVTDAIDLSGSTVKLAGIKGSSKWAVGEKLTLIDNGNNVINGVGSKLNGQFNQGIKNYKYEIEKIENDKKLQATITDAGVGEQAKSLSEGRIAGLGSLNSGADLAADKGMANATEQSSGKGGYDAFGAMGYGNSKQKSGSYADSKGTSMMLGMARELKGDSSTTTLGFFFEGGNSTYDTFNHFADAGDVRANGKNKYFGGGIMARKLNNSNIYYEGSLRVGRMNSDYDSRDLGTKYDTKSTYYGIHLGIGKIIKIANDAELDIYGKYFWSHQNSATAMIDGEAFNFDALDSHRLRAGTRYTTQTGSNVKSYIGLAYEHELDGKAGAMTTGERVAEPSVKGGTGIAEVGIIYKPTEKSNFSMDLGVSGYAGKREGFGGQLKLNWGF